MTDIDIKLFQDDQGFYDIAIDPATGDFVLTEGFDTSLISSLFEERRANETQIVPPQNRRGWWGNELFDEFSINNFQIGSLLWLLHQARLTQNVVNDAEDFARASLQWLIDDGHADSVEVSAQRSLRLKALIIDINIFRGGNLVESRSYDIWQRTEVTQNQINPA